MSNKAKNRAYRSWKPSKDLETKFNLQEGKLYLNCLTKNLKTALTDLKGRVVYTCSCGKLGFKNSKKKTPVAYEEVMKRTLRELKGGGISRLHVVTKGFSNSRNVAMKQLVSCEAEILSLEDRTQIQFGGCRAPRMKR